MLLDHVALAELQQWREGGRERERERGEGWLWPRTLS